MPRACPLPEPPCYGEGTDIDSGGRGQLQFFVAPKTLGDYPTMEFLWFLLFDHIHHRGQLSVYLRMVGKVPSIYGPSGDQL
jgi:DinB family protein